MAKYDGLIIPRSYSDYINKTDAATLSQALQLNNVLDDAPTEDSRKGVRSGGVYTALAGKQPTLTFDDAPTDGSSNPVKSDGIYDALATKQDTLTFDNEPTDGSNNPVKSNGIFDAMKALLPIGLVFPFAGSTVPASFLECDGSAVSRTTYAELFDVIGTTYGTGDGSTTFNLPDYREVALVGAGQNTTDSITDHDVYTVGQFKDDQAQSHYHNLRNSAGNITYGSNSAGSVEKSLCYGNAGIYSYITMTENDGRKGSTTHGKQKGVKYLIKVL